jgi:hypothetical protein
MMELIRNGDDPPSQDPSAPTFPPFYTMGEDEPTAEVAARNKAKAKKVYTARGSSYTSFEDVLLCRAWLATSMDAICGTEQKGTRLWEKIHAHFHHQKEYVQPHPIVSDRNAGSLQHRWASIQESVNKYCGFHAQVLNRNQSGVNVTSHVSYCFYLVHCHLFISSHFIDVIALLLCLLG